MKQSPDVIRVGLICNNATRELATFISLKHEFENSLGARVKIIGSIAEIQRTLHSLFIFKPHVVFISQLQEDSCRTIARYVKKSGALLIILPEEITPARVVTSIVVNPKLKYDHLVDLVLLPGRIMYNMFLKTDIDVSKLFITGAPKMDVEYRQKGRSRSELTKLLHLDSKKKNVFIFTSFAHSANIEYYRGNKCFSGSMRLIIKIQKVIRDTRLSYLEVLPKICNQFPQYNIVLKPHPLEDLSYYRQLKAPNLVISSRLSMQDCFPSIDLAIHWNSTIATSSWLHKIPTLQYSPLKVHDWLLSDFTRGNPLVHSYHKLFQLIERYIEKPGTYPHKHLLFQEGYLSENFFKIDGRSQHRIVKQTSKLLKECKIRVNYEPQFNPVWYIMMFFEKLFGVLLSRRLAAVMIRNYNWRYAVDNYLP